MDARTRRRLDRSVAQVQPVCPRPIEALLWASHAGTLGRALMRRTNPLGAWLAGRRARREAAELPLNVVMALTDEAIHVYGYKPKGFGGIKVKRQVAVWPREGIRVELDPAGTVTTRATFHTPQRPVVLEVPTAMGGDAILAAFLEQGGFGVTG